MTSIRSVLRSCFVREPASDQSYHEASVENALKDRDELIGRLASIAKDDVKVNQGLIAGVERVKQTAERPDVMADFVRDMRSALWS